VLDKKVNIEVLLLVFFSTFSIYNLQRVIKHFFQKKNHSSRHLWIFKNNFILSFFVGVSSIVAIIIFFKIFSLKHFVYLLPFSLVSVFYAIAVFSKNRALRDLPFVKVFLIAVTWAVSSVTLPSIELNLIYQSKTIFLFFFNFIFILALTIPFDIRDINLDHEKTKTIPQVFGIQGAIKIISFLLFLCLIISVIFLKEYLFFVPLVVSYILIKKTKKEMPELFYSGILDGIILLYPLISFIY
jgi:4-hydroxybenzoate polyprenyltransferase